MGQLDFSHVKDQVWAEVRRAMKLSNHTEGFWDNLQGFVHAIDWRVRAGRNTQHRVVAASNSHPPLWVGCLQEPWIRGVLAAHVTIVLVVLLFRRNVAVLTAVFALLGEPSGT
jgi:hypothetical protein